VRKFCICTLVCNVIFSRYYERDLYRIGRKMEDKPDSLLVNPSAIKSITCLSLFVIRTAYFKSTCPERSQLFRQSEKKANLSYAEEELFLCCNSADCFQNSLTIAFLRIKRKHLLSQNREYRSQPVKGPSRLFYIL